MNIKGTAFVTAKVAISAGFGEERWNAFVAKLAAKDKFFSNVIMSITPIPIEKHVLFLDELLKEFFNNDKEQYWMFGKVAANFALSPGGPYNSYLMAKDIRQFVEKGMPGIWHTYFDGGKLEAKLENNIAHIKLTGIPIAHVYYEYMIIGYFKKALRMFGKKTVEHRIKSFANGDKEIYYQYELKDA